MKAKNNKRRRVKRIASMMKKMRKDRKVCSIKIKSILIDEFKAYRRVLFAIGKAMKYTFWVSFGLFWYHMYLLKKTEKPEKGFMANEFFLNLAKNADYSFYDLKLLLTRPPVEKLLPDRPPLPPGAAYPKTLILNLRGTLVHSEYKVLL
jgi:hypothetical protein